jgi:hypothetical protein
MSAENPPRNDPIAMQDRILKMFSGLVFFWLTAWGYWSQKLKLPRVVIPRKAMLAQSLLCVIFFLVNF